MYTKEALHRNIKILNKHSHCVNTGQCKETSIQGEKVNIRKKERKKTEIQSVSRL
jgi:DNA-binding sugar fermentation-stimulating protein